MQRDIQQHIIGIAILAAALAMQLPLALNHDAAWHFYTAFRVLQGAEIGVDIVDMNPPMSAWLFTLPAFFANVSGVSPSLCFKLFTALVCAVGYGLSVELLARARPTAGGPRPEAIALAVALFILPGYDFGQREHLVAALTAPYVIMAACRAGNVPVATGLAVVVGILAAAGIGVKPYFAALPLILESWLLLKRSTFRTLLRPEALTIAVAGFVYLAAVGLFAPEYYRTVVPAAMQSYGGYDLEWPALLRVLWGELALVGVGFLLSVLAWSRFRFSLVTQASLCAAAAFLIAVLLQRKGWAYQAYPVTMYLVFAAGLLFADRAKTTKPAGVLSIVAIAVIFLAVAIKPAVFVADGHAAGGTSSRVRALTQVFSDHGDAGGTVFAFVTSPRDIHPAVLEARKVWAIAAGAMIHLPAYVDEMSKPVASADRPAIQAIAAAHDRQVINDLIRTAPGVIAIDDGMTKLGMENHDFDYLKYYSKYNDFNTMMKRYDEIERIGKFRIFVRRSAGNSAHQS